MIILWIVCIAMAVSMLLVGIGGALKGNIFSGFVGIFVGLFGAVIITGSIYSEINPAFKSELENDKKIAFKNELEECKPLYKMIKQPFYGDDYVFFCSNNTELNVSEKQYNSIDLEIKSYEKTKIDRNFHFILLGLMIFVVAPVIFLVSRVVY